MYQNLDAHYSNVVLVEEGLTAAGKPLHLFIISDGQEFEPAAIKAQGKAVLMINNGIHAGEPAGIDASLQFADDILRNNDGMTPFLERAVLVIIPAYNIRDLSNLIACHRGSIQDYINFPL